MTSVAISARFSTGPGQPAYIAPGATFPMRDVPPGVVAHVQIEKIYSQGPWHGDEAEDPTD